ncbi:HAMP domain-containing sensor histidine kinase [Nodularia harveyana UHCC-0300]|uniref:histidine kinase n=1 Tax=Nodularia harveyana UHCC-0300 TaxID=2974287 RepID=A0ABU5UGC6_9CYAN|nr:HAMP domain-containing sensor histidine kinase [Nodularia harveyana]MEA5582607.1 HAMP domain-containing sensor histidine kinase [Nodularia harveyana UHCC-0300]
MYQWILPSLSEILAENQATVAECSPMKAEQQWRISLAATEQLLINTLATGSPDATTGLVLTAPAPLFSQPKLTQSLQTVTFTAKPFNPLALMPFQMPQAATENIPVPPESVLSLLPADPLVAERFCLVFTDKFRLVLVLKEDKNGDKFFAFSFDPEVVDKSWRSLGARIMLTNPELYAEVDTLVQKYDPVAPDYRTVIQFSQLLLQELAEPEANQEASETSAEWEQKIEAETPNTPALKPDVELLQAFAHEVRTPLSTIRTLTRLLLKRRDLPDTVTNRLQIIDHECTEQIDRMELLFKAAELETSASLKSANTQLTPMSLDQVLLQSVPRWKQAAQRRNLTLDVVLPQHLPTVVSNPNMLDRVLTGLLENFTRSLPPGSHIQVQVIPAGDQLKLQLSPQSHCPESNSANETVTPPIRKALGQLLMFQPETGTISLNIAATKHLFQAIGGKLIVRQRQHYGEVLTIFLPLEVSSKQKVISH